MPPTTPVRNFAFRKDANIWKQCITQYVHDAGVWKTINNGYVHDAGIWKRYINYMPDSTYLQMWMPFNNSHADYSHNYVTGTNSGCTYVSNNHGENAIRLDAKTDYLAYNSSGVNGISSNITFAFWIKIRSVPTTSGTSGIILSRNNNNSTYLGAWWIETYGSYSSLFFTTGGSYKGLHMFENKINTWQHVVMTVDYNKHVKRYYDGDLYFDYITDFSTFDTSTNEVRFGDYYSASSYGSYGGFFDMFDFRIYNRVITDNEAKALYYYGL